MKHERPRIIDPVDRAEVMNLYKMVPIPLRLKCVKIMGFPNCSFFTARKTFSKSHIRALETFLNLNCIDTNKDTFIGSEGVFCIKQHKIYLKNLLLLINNPIFVNYNKNDKRNIIEEHQRINKQINQYENENNPQNAHN